MYFVRRRSRSSLMRARTVSPSWLGFCTTLKKPTVVKSHIAYPLDCIWIFCGRRHGVMPDIVHQQQLDVVLGAKVEHIQAGRALPQPVAVAAWVDAQEVRDYQAVGGLVRDDDDG